MTDQVVNAITDPVFMISLLVGMAVFARVFTLLPAAMIVMARRFHRAGDAVWAWLNAIAAHVFFGCFVLASMGFSQHPALMPYGGLWQRLALIIGLGWLAVLAIRLRRPLTSARSGRPIAR